MHTTKEVAPPQQTALTKKLESVLDKPVLDKSDIIGTDGLTSRQKKKIAKAAKKADKSPEAVLAEFKEKAAPINEKFDAACAAYGERMKASLEDIAGLGKEIDTLLKGRDEKIPLAKLWDEVGFKFSYQTATNYKNVFLNLDKVLKNREMYLLKNPGSEYSLSDAYEVARPTRRNKKVTVEATQSTEKPPVKKRAVLIVISDDETKINDIAGLVEGEGIEKITFFAEQAVDAAKASPFIEAVNAYAAIG